MGRVTEKRTCFPLIYQNSLLVCSPHVQSGENIHLLSTSRHMPPTDFETENMRVSHLELL